MEKYLVYKKGSIKPIDSKESWKNAMNSFKNTRWRFRENERIKSEKNKQSKEKEDNEKEQNNINELENKKKENLTLASNIMAAVLTATSHLNSEETAKITAAITMAFAQK